MIDLFIVLALISSPYLVICFIGNRFSRVGNLLVRFRFALILLFVLYLIYNLNYNQSKGGGIFGPLVAIVGLCFVPKDKKF